MATMPALLPIEKYLRTSYSPDVDFVDGEIEERNLGEFEHATFQAAISGWFWERRRDWGIQAVVEQRIRVAPSCVRIADFAILRPGAPREKVTETPPLVCIEVMSPEDRISRVKVRLADYFQMGVENIWLIDPLRRTAQTFDGVELHPADPANLRVAGSAVFLDLTEAFEAIA